MLNNKKNNNPADPSPLDDLGLLLSTDMQSVNDIIVNKMESPVALIPQLASYLISAGGKRIRPLMTLASTAIYNGDMARAHVLSAAVEFIHAATLLHDDVVDESVERRGKPSANVAFGNQASVLVGDFLFSRAFQLMVADGSLDALRILSDASAIIAQGEVLQLTTAGNIDTSMESYLDVIKAKTAALFAAACEIGPVICGAGRHAAQAMAEYGLYLGIAFQISDDTLDYIATHDRRGKKIGDDFREGKMTAPIIFALENASTEEKKFWQRTLRDKKQEDGDFEHALEIIQKHKGIEKSLAMAGTYGQQAQLALAEAPDHALRLHLHNLVDFTIRREF